MLSVTSAITKDNFENILLLLWCSVVASNISSMINVFASLLNLHFTHDLFHSAYTYSKLEARGS